MCVGYIQCHLINWLIHRLSRSSRWWPGTHYVVLNSWSSCFSLSSARITDICLLAWPNHAILCNRLEHIQILIYEGGPEINILQISRDDCIIMIYPFVSSFLTFVFIFIFCNGVSLSCPGWSWIPKFYYSFHLRLPSS
jgi:hypothetical protein